MVKQLEIDQLIQLCKKKDEPAQMEVYNRYHLAMYHSALRIVQNRVDAEDVMQESFLTAFEKLEQYKGGNKFGGWLKQITLRKALHFCEQRSKQKTSSLKEGWFYVNEGETNDNEKSQTIELHKALNELIPRYRNALMLMYFEGYDYEELSNILQLSYGNCRTLISRAKEQLKQKIEVNELHR